MILGEGFVIRGVADVTFALFKFLMSWSRYGLLQHWILTHKCKEIQVGLILNTAIFPF